MRDNLIGKKQRKQYISRDKNPSTNNFYQGIIKTRIKKIGNYYNWCEDNTQQTPNTKV